MTILTHLNKRLKSRPQIQLPVDSLLSQYQVSYIHIYFHFVSKGYHAWANPMAESSEKVLLLILIVLLSLLFKR